jgi:hypothetical protein
MSINPLGSTALFLFYTLVASTTAQIVSDQCDSETRILNNNTALLQTSVPILPCNIDFDVSDTCTVDYDSVSTNYSNACINAGGQFYTTDVTLDCNVNLGGQTYNGKSYYLNTPSCIGISCTGSEIDKEFEANLYPKLEESYASRGVQCEISNSYSIWIIVPQFISTLVVVPITFLGGSLLV